MLTIKGEEFKPGQGCQYHLLVKTDKERARFFLLGLCRLVEGFVLLLSLGRINTELSAWFIFEDPLKLEQ